MQFISDEYRSLNQELHATNKEYGCSGALYLDHVVSLIKQLKTTDILDYGCGKGQLAAQLPFNIKQYDPAVEKYAALPEPADLVVCTDVLEHIEPEYLENVLIHIKELTKKLCYLVIATIPAKKTLADGRNAHLIVKPYGWWFNELTKHFDIFNFQHMLNRIGVVVAPIGSIDKELLKNFK